MFFESELSEAEFFELFEAELPETEFDELFEESEIVFADFETGFLVRKPVTHARGLFQFIVHSFVDQDSILSM